MVKRKSGQTTPGPSLTKEGSLEKTALVPEAEQPYPIPENWVWTNILAVTDINMGQSPVGEHTNKDANGLPLVGGPADMGDIYPTSERFTSKPTKICVQGDIIMSVRATIGKLNIADREYCLGRGVAGIRGIRSNQKFIKRFLETCTQSLKERGTGTTFLQVSKSDISSLPIPLPPLPEQQRIAEKLESLLGKIKEAKALLDEIPEILKNFRQSVLASACSGRLTEDWRKAAGLKIPVEKALGEILKVSSGKFLPAKKMTEGGAIPVFGGNGINGYHDEGNVQEETLVLGRVGFYCGCIHMTPKLAWVTDNALIMAHPQNLWVNLGSGKLPSV